MPLLDAMLEKRIRLIDYEMMKDEKGMRTVAFGKYAGMLGKERREERKKLRKRDRKK